MMDESVAEGISTSLHTCSPILLPYDSQGNHELDPLPSSPPSFLHVNDPGLTLSPGSQLEQSTDATRARDGFVANDSDVREPPQQFWGDENAFLENTKNFEFADTFFDSELALQLLDAPFDTRKRTGDEAFPTEFGLQARAKKRQAVEQPQTQNIPLPVDTPSLSSPDSSHPPDQVETTPNTPTDIERSQTPDSLFDSLDGSLEHYSNPTPAVDITSSNKTEEASSVSKNTEQSVASAHEIAGQNGTRSYPSSIVDTVQQFFSATQQHQPEYASSNLTKQRFSLNAQDVITSANREMLKRVDPEPQYVSPYPVYGSTLGYLPSSPEIHVKYIKLANDHVCDRIDCLEHQVQRLTYERDKYKKAWSDSTTIDQETGKSKEQLLQQKNTTLLRISSRDKGKIEASRKEAEEWRNRFYDLARIYNNLLFDVQTRQQLPTVSRPPMECYTRAVYGERSQQQHPSLNPQPRATYSEHPLHQPVLYTASDRPAAQQPNSRRPSHSLDSPLAPSNAGPVTIDLTDETHNETPNPIGSPALPSRGADSLRSFQNKKYDWLGNNNENQSRSQWPPDNRPSHSIPPSRQSSENQAATDQSGTVSAGESVADDDFALELEEELAGC